MDAGGNPLASSAATASDDTAPPPPPPPDASSLLLDDNIIAKFLTVVISRVPEIAPSVADLLPDASDPLVLWREFPGVVDATLAELRKVGERLARME